MLVLKTLPDAVCLIQPDVPSEFQLLFRLRWEMLRKPWGLPPGSEQDAEEEHTIHRAILRPADVPEMLACGRIQETEPGLAQVRYMAVDHRFHGKGYGMEVLRSLEEAARSFSGCGQIFLKARENALGFYLKAGYRLDTEIEPYLGIRHFRMLRELS